MTVWVIHSGETGAPVNTGQVGSFTTLLDTLLTGSVNSSATGWSASYAGGVITYAKTGHGMPIGIPGTLLTVTGFSPSGYNIANQLVTVVDANTITLTASNPGSTPATGTGTVARPGLGWTTSFTGTNLRTYRGPTGNRFYFGVDDTNATSPRVRMFETASAAGVAVASGSNPTPSDAQLSGGLFHTKSTTADATARPWLFVSNGNIFYMLMQQGSLATTGNGVIFGDFTSYKTSDAYGSIIVGDGMTAATSTSIRVCSLVTSPLGLIGHYVPRAYTQIGSSLNVGKGSNAFFANGALEMGSGGFTYPIGVEGGIMLSPVWICEGLNGARGHLPGFWNPCHSRPLSHGDTFSGVASTPLAGKTFEVFNVGNNGQIILETSDTWDA